MSTNLAAELSKQGKTVLIDCDMPKGTSASWYAVRDQAGKAGTLIADTATTLANFPYHVYDGSISVTQYVPRSNGVVASV